MANRLKNLCAFALVLLTFVACDPCRTLAEKICECAEIASERDACKNDIDLRGKHADFDKVKDAGLCQAVLDDKSCSCLQIRNGQIDQCGLANRGPAT